jgi:glycosyltransferase involved in cell wall biosynthesis
MNQSDGNLRAALLHDWLTGFRGGERVLEAFCEIFPSAPIYTLLHKPGSTSHAIEEHSIHTSFLNRVPGIERNYRKFLPFFPLATDRMKIEEEVEVVLSSCHCVIKGLQKPRGSTHISYIHSPMRYMYDQYDHYFGPHAPFLQRVGARLFRNYLVNWDKASNRNVDVMVANSAFVRERIRKFYGRDAEVVHPFVELADFVDVQKTPPPKGEEFIMVTAFAPNKRVDLAIESFNALRLPLTIIGSGQLERELKAMAGPTVKFLGNVGRRDVIDTLARARALIFPGVEDFGITPLEALASGTPVIAYRAGGVLETLRDDDSVFFSELSVNSLSEAILRFEREGRTVNISRLEKFSRERFLREMNAVIAASTRS